MKNASTAGFRSLARLAPIASFAALAALAAPSVAFAQAAPTPSTPPPASAAALAPAAPVAPAAPDTIATAATPAPAAAPAEAAPPVPAPAPAPAEAPLPWAGSNMFGQFSFPTYGILRGQQQSPDDAVNFWFRLAPRWTLSPKWQLRGVLAGNGDVGEGINTGSTYKREFLFGDPIVTLFYMGIPKLPGGIRMLAGTSLRLPLSKASWAQTLIAAPGITTQFAKGFEAFGGETLVLVSGSYSHPFYQSVSPLTPNELPYARSTFVGAQATGFTADQISGIANARDVFSMVAFAVQTWGKWAPGVFMLASTAIPYTFKDLGMNQTNVATYHLRSSTFFGAWLDYEVNDWLTPELGYQMSRSLLDGDGTWGNPVFSRYQDTQVYLGANIQIDALYKALKGESAAAGVVRAMRRPIGLSF